MTETLNKAEALLAEGNSDWVADLLREREITYNREVIPVASIDMDASLHNQARQAALHDETVAMYQAAMENGDQFPAIVVRRLHGKYVVADGNHRVRAATLANFTHMHAFVINEAADRQVELFTYEANTKHGLPTSLEERIRQGLYLVEVGNVPKVVATALNIPEQRFYKEVNLARFEARMLNAGVDLGGIAVHTRIRLGAIRNDNVVKALAELFREAGIGTTEQGELVTKIRQIGTEKDALDFIEQRRAEQMPFIRSTAGGKLPFPKNVNRLRLASRLTASIETDKIGAQVASLDPEVRTAIRTEAIKAIAVLAEAVDAVKRAV